MQTITATIITKNEAHNINDCLESVKWMDEIIVLDSGSTDGTQEICRKHNVKIIETDWPGFGKQKQRALSMAKTDWIFPIDADERVTLPLKQEIIETINSNPPYAAYMIKRLNFILGKPVTHYKRFAKDHPVRLLKRGYGNYTNDIVHEGIIAKSNIGILKNTLPHYYLQNITEIIDKINLYSTLEAKKALTQGKKVFLPSLIFSLPRRFFSSYFLKKACLDGMAGFVLAVADSHNYFYRKLKMYYAQSSVRSAL